MNKVIQFGEKAIALPTLFPGESFAFQGRVLAATAELMLLEENPGDPARLARLRAHLRALVQEGITLAELRKEPFAAFAMMFIARADKDGAILGRLLITDWGMAVPGEAAPWEHLFDLERKLGNHAAALAAAEQARRAEPDNRALQKRLQYKLNSANPKKSDSPL